MLHNGFQGVHADISCLCEVCEAGEGSELSMGWTNNRNIVMIALNVTGRPRTDASSTGWKRWAYPRPANKDAALLGTLLERDGSNDNLICSGVVGMAKKKEKILPLRKLLKIRP
jgi:hypothetical protein